MGNIDDIATTRAVSDERIVLVLFMGMRSGPERRCGVAGVTRRSGGWRMHPAPSASDRGVKAKRSSRAFLGGKAREVSDYFRVNVGGRFTLIIQIGRIPVR